jgi:hypothetical protein
VGTNNHGYHPNAATLPERHWTPSATPMAAASASKRTVRIVRTGLLRIRSDTFLPKRAFTDCGVDIVIVDPREFDSISGPSKFHVLRAVTPFGSRHFVHRRHITLHVLPACNASIVTVETGLLSSNSLLNEPGNVFEGLHVAGRPFSRAVVPHIQHSDGETCVRLDRRCHIGDQIRSRVIPQ